MTDDPFGRRGDEEEGSGIPGGWLPPRADDRPAEAEEEHRPLWTSAGEARPERPVFEQPGAARGTGTAAAPRGPSSSGRTASGRATAALVLGIVGLVICPFVCSVLAIVLGGRARREIDASGGQLSGRGNATAGIVLGWVGLVLSLLFIALIAAGTIAWDGSSGSDGDDDALFSLLWPGSA